LIVGYEPCSTDSLLELIPLFQGQRVRLGNDGNDIDDLGELLEYHDIDLTSVSIPYISNKRTYRLQGVSSRVDEEQTTMNTGIGDMSISKRS
jgi:hypothetical protein